MTSSNLKPGDEVSYVFSRQSGSSVHISSRTGVLVEVSGGLSIVKARNGRKVAVRTNSLRPTDQPNAITESLNEAIKGA